ncbi:MAG: hypothetical protein F4Y14_04690, partial [Acidobacteria bacterium]|nr:hypothetical protein [Acidobacteriota bacterium]
LSAVSTEAVTLTVAATAVSPATASDYNLSTNKTLTIAAGSTTSTGTVTITAVNNDVDGPDKEVTVSATVTGGNGVAAPSDKTLTITDDDTRTVSLALGSASISENSGSTAVTATLSAVSTEAVTLTVSATAVSPATSADFTLSANKTLTIAAGTTTSTGTVTITAVNNAVEGSDRQVTVSATVEGGNGVAAPADKTLTITDDDTRTVSLVLASSSISENGGSTAVTATLNATSTQAVTLTVSSLAVSPTVSGDFTQTGTTLTIAAGATTSTGTVTIAAVNNSVDGPDKKVTVSATASGGNDVADPSDQTLTITDDESAPTVSLVLGSSSISENGGSTAVTATLSAVSTEAVTLTVSATAVSPATSSDFSLSTNKTLTITAGATTSTGTVTITAVNNSVEGSDKEVTVSATVSGGNGVAAPSDKTLTITDDDTRTVSLVLGSSSIEEGSGSTTVTATLNAASSQAVTLTVSSSPVSPALSGDFTQSGTTLTIAAGATTSTGTVTITAGDNDTVAADKKVTVSATATGGNGVAAPSDQTLTISEDDTATLTFASTAVSVREGAKASFIVELSTTVASDVTFSWQTADGSATAGSDYTAQAATSVTLAAGSTEGILDVQTLTDSVREGDETFTVKISASNLPTGVSLGTATATATIAGTASGPRTDLPSVSLVLSSPSISENGGSSTVTATLSEASSEAVTVVVSATPKSPAVAGDFTLTGSKLQIAAGSTTSTGTVTITAVDNDVEAADKSVTVSASVSGGNGVDPPASRILTITDDDGAPTVSLALSSSSISENGGSTTVTATLSKESSQAVTVTVSAAPVSPAVAEDFTLTGSTLTIAAGATTSTGTVTITAVDNEVDAPDKEVTVSGTVSGAGGIAAPANQTLTITDDESPPGESPSTTTLAIGPASQTVAEGDSASFTVTLSQALAADVSFRCTTSDGTATGGVDYVAVAAQMDTITAGKTEFVLTLPTSGDSEEEGEETFSMTLTADDLPDGVTLGTTSVTVTITDGDQTPRAPPVPSVIVQVDPRYQTVVEGVTAEATLSLLGPEPQDMSFTLSAVEHGATAGADFAVREDATVTIAAGETEATVRVRTIEDDVLEADETFSIVFTSDDPTIGALASTITIVDDDDVTLSIGPATQAVAEGDDATVTVSLSSPVSDDVAFTWETEDRSATAGADYKAPTDGTTTIPAGGTSVTLTIPTVDDDEVEGNERFKVRLSADSLPDRCVLDETTAFVTIEDSDRVTLSVADVSVDEGDTASVAVSLSGALPTELVFGWQTADGTAVPGADYTAQPYAETAIAPGETTAILSIPTTADGLVEGDEAFAVTIEPLDLPRGVDVGATTATATIVDDDRAVLSVGPSPQTVPEGGTVHFRIEISAAVDHDMAVSWSTVGGDSEAGTDYVFASGTVTFAAGDTQGKSISVETVEDTIIEEEETFTIEIETVNSIPDGVTLGPPAEVRIGDVNRRPVADAGDDILVDPGELVTLDGSSSSDRENGTLLWLWSQTGGEPVALSDSASVNPSFTAPDQPGPVTFSLVVDDGIAASEPDHVTVTVRDAQPRFLETVDGMSYEAGRRIDPVTLPEASGGNGALAYTLESEPTGLGGLNFDPVTRVLSGTPRHAGRFTFTYRVDDADADRSLGDAAVQSFPVLVNAAAEKAVLEKTLAAFGRGTLFGAIDSIGYRFSDAPGAGVFSVAGQQVPLDDSGSTATATGSGFSSGFGQSLFGGGGGLGSGLGGGQHSGFGFGPGAFGGGFGGWSYGPGMGTPPFGGNFGLGSVEISSSPPAAPEILDRRERTARLLGGTSFV